MIAVRKNDKYYYLILRDITAGVRVHTISKEEFDLY
jgi:hypothetical protein